MVSSPDGWFASSLMYVWISESKFECGWHFIKAKSCYSRQPITGFCTVNFPPKKPTLDTSQLKQVQSRLWKDVSADIHLFSLAWLYVTNLLNTHTNTIKMIKAQHTPLSTKQWERGPKIKAIWIIDWYKNKQRTVVNTNLPDVQYPYKVSCKFYTCAQLNY